MKFFKNHVISCHSDSDVDTKFKRKMIFHIALEGVKLIVIIAIAGFFLIEYAAPFVQRKVGVHFPSKMNEFFSLTKSSRDSSVKEILHLANLIRWITEDQLPEGKILRYAGLVFHASQRCGVNPIEIIALIMAESGFKENSINKETGDYGLGQVNWEHWGKDYGYTPQQLLDPSVNIFLTCHVYQFFGQDFGKYHRGSGIQCKAYLVNVKSILSTLNAFAELNQEKVS
ncbi:MAG: transglycosylase SLT domain-containing protein [Syntrophaceae bacterium]|nr:transglycosylase SLT domain-containing protein [Syntrophaceae bacterium]